ncbi:MAG: hypothetical protein H6755_03540 [Candidatus Omnitrophica bacterium]|nr:hypothetical protein [Candidatus Omnitrophota bacterium]
MFKNKFNVFLTILVIAFAFVGINKANRWLEGQVPKKTVVLEEVPADTVSKQKKEKVKPIGAVVRKTRFDPSRDFEENILFDEDIEIARFKSVEDKIYDLEGEIPDGKIKFFNESKNTYGEEEYWGGKRHGFYREYYGTGELKKETEYKYGQKWINKEYFIDGKMRLEEYLDDALFFANTKEVGVGKVYYRSGVLMYEWNITNKGKERYNKSYNIDGKVMSIKYFDENGQLIKEIKPEI